MTKVVYLNDSAITYEEAQTFFVNAHIWAKNQCQSYVSFHVQDVSDVSYIYDHIAAYHFNDPKDAVLFELRWGTH